MKISFCSDLHLEFGYQSLPGGEVLVLAGDICELASLKKEFHQTRLLDRTPGGFSCWDFFEYECAKYDRVFMVMGNHEHYRGRFDRTYQDLKQILPSNVRLLECEQEEYNGVIFLGGTLWTDCNRNDPITIHTLKFGMNDYRVIKNCYKTSEGDVYHKLTPEATVASHRKTLEYFQNILSTSSDRPAVMITHHAPHSMSIDPRFKNEHYMNGGYASNLSEFILDNQNIKLWIHGHCHNRSDYTIGETRVVTNPRGYLGHEDTTSFDPSLFIQLGN